MLARGGVRACACAAGLGPGVGVGAGRRRAVATRGGDAGPGGRGRGRGALIVLEGIDRSGKSTQARRLVGALEGQLGRGRVEHWRFPDRTTRPIGETVDAFLRSGAASAASAASAGREGRDPGAAARVGHLLFSANRWEKRAALVGALEAGTTLVVDRYVHSGVAYGAAQGLDPAWCRGPDAGLPAPDLVIFLDLAVDESVRRGGFGGERFETEGMQRRVADAFRALMEEEAEEEAEEEEGDPRRAGAIPWARVDAALDEDALHHAIKAHAEEALARCADRPIRTLWTGRDLS